MVAEKTAIKEILHMGNISNPNERRLYVLQFIATFALKNNLKRNRIRFKN